MNQLRQSRIVVDDRINYEAVIAAMKLMLVLEKRDGRETTTPNENEWSGGMKMKSSE